MAFVKNHLKINESNLSVLRAVSHTGSLLALVTKKATTRAVVNQRKKTIDVQECVTEINMLISMRIIDAVWNLHSIMIAY